MGSAVQKCQLVNNGRFTSGHKESLVAKPSTAWVTLRGARSQRLFCRGGREKGRGEAVHSYKRG